MSYYWSNDINMTISIKIKGLFTKKKLRAYSPKKKKKKKKQWTPTTQGEKKKKRWTPTLFSFDFSFLLGQKLPPPNEPLLKSKYSRRSLSILHSTETPKSLDYCRKTLISDQLTVVHQIKKQRSIDLRSMSKEFNIPPVVFPNGGNPGPGIGPGVQQRRPTAPFQPPRSSNPGIPFMSFDADAASSSFSTPQFASSTIGGGGVGFEDEPPLLEELGINTKQIYQKTVSILNPFRVKPDLHEDADLSGPFLFLMAFGLFQLLAGKLHFGIILGWVTVASMFLYVVFNMLAGRNGNLDLYRCVSLIGYCMLPVVILSAISLFVPQGGIPIMVMTGVFVIWSTRVCTRLLVELASCGDEHRGLIAYACFLIYALFSLLVMFWAIEFCCNSLRNLSFCSWDISFYGYLLYLYMILVFLYWRCWIKV